MPDSCPNGCDRAVSSGHIMCVVCWRQVPVDLQRDLHRAWRVYAANPTDRAWAAYAVVRDQALAAVAGEAS